MHIQLKEDCTSFAATIDGQDINEMTPSEKALIAEELLQKAKEAFVRGDISMRDLITIFPHDRIVELPQQLCKCCAEPVRMKSYIL